jgi:hypothetical protein
LKKNSQFKWIKILEKALITKKTASISNLISKILKSV